MRTTLRFVLSCSALAALSLPLPLLLHAASGDTVVQGAVIIEQEHPEDALRTWSLVNEREQQFSGQMRQDTARIPAGSYTFFIDQPQGYTTSVRLYQGTELLKSVDHPQLSFTYDGVTELRIFVSFHLSFSGQVNVVSTPTGIPFELRGPDGLYRQGVTSQSYDDMPVGLYSVRYLPEGCTEPPPKSKELRHESRVDFSVTVSCASLQERHEEKQQDIAPYASTIVQGEELVFRDVPVESWFAPHVIAVARKGIMSGYRNEDGSSAERFGPENPLTLAEVAKIMHELSGTDEGAIHSAPQTMSGTSAGWAARYVASAQERDWLVFTGTGVDVHRPATRSEVLVTMLQALDIPLQWAKGETFNDVTRRTPHAAAIETAAKDGIVTGSTDSAGAPTGSFEPESPVNRAEMAKILMVAIEKYKLEVGAEGS